MYVKAIYCHPAYLISMQSIACKMLGWMNHKLESRFPAEIATSLSAESKEELKSLLMRVKEESEKCGLKLSIQKTKITVSGPISSWEIEEEIVEAGTSFLFLGSKIIADGDCSHIIKRHLVLGRKAMTNLDSVLKSRGIHLLADNGEYSQSYGFSSSLVLM